MASGSEKSHFPEEAVSDAAAQRTGRPSQACARRVERSMIWTTDKNKASDEDASKRRKEDLNQKRHAHVVARLRFRAMQTYLDAQCRSIPTKRHSFLLLHSDASIGC